MRIVFFGSSQFGVPSLRALKEARNDIACVVTQPDRKKGRHLQMEGTAVKKIAQELNLPVYQPESVNAAQSIEYLEGLRPELFVVIAYGQILSRDVLALPRLGAVNAHASLLPRYRGAAPINWAIINGDKITGVSVMKMNERMDAGPVLFQKEYKISPEETSVSLETALSGLTVPLVSEAIAAIAEGKARLHAQNKQRVTYAHKLKRKDGLIDWKDSAEGICRRIRGCMGWPGTYTYWRGKVLKVYAAHPQTMTEGLGPGKAGELLGSAQNRICVATGKGILAIEELQLEGGTRLAARDFLSGHTLKAGEILG